MDLQALLRKTEAKSEKIRTTRTIPSVATEERPYTNDLAAVEPVRASELLTKQVTNREQTGNKEVTEQVTNREQTGNKEVTEATLVQISPSTTKPKQVTERVTSERVNRVQTGNKEVTNLSWDTLRGHEARLLQLIFDECRATGDLLSPPLTLDRIALSLGSRKETAKTITTRLVKKGFAAREASATGRGGFTRFRLEKSLYQSLLIRESGNKRVTNREQTGNKEDTQRVTERVTSAPSSSSFLDLENSKTTTTGEPELLGNIPAQLSPDWQAFDVSPLAEIGFSQTHLIQIIRQGKLTSAEVQESVHFFAFDLKRNGKGTSLNGSPLNFFMGILRKGIPYAPPENFESPADEARRKTREFKERKECERQAEEQKIMDLEFSEWRRGVASDELAALLPEFARRPGPIQDSALRTHFETAVWPERAQELLGLGKLDRSEVGNQIEQSLAEAKT